jgi:hypothetical protein
MTTITVRAARHDDISSLLSSVAGLFREDGGRYDPLRDIEWPAREGARYYRALRVDRD